MLCKLLHRSRYLPKGLVEAHIDQSKIITHTDSTLSTLIQGDLFLYHSTYEDSALTFFQLALDKAISRQDSILICEAAKKIQGYYIYSDFDIEAFKRYHSIHKDYAYDQEEVLFTTYYNLRFRSQSKYKKKEVSLISEKEWKDAIDKSLELNNMFLASELSSIKGVYHEIHENNFKKAQHAYLKAIEYARNIDSLYMQSVSFTSYGNIGNLHHTHYNIGLAIKFYEKAIAIKHNFQQPKSLIRINEWLSQCYAEKLQHEKPLHHLEKAFEIEKKYQLDIQKSKVKEIEKKYQNEKLTNDLSQETIKRKQFYITSLTLGGLLSLSLIGLYGFRRINKLKQTNFHQQIKETEQQGQLAAINAQLDGEEQERKRVATTLHDGIASHLTAASFHLQTILQQNDSTQAADKAAQLIVEAAERTRQLSHDLYPPVLIRDGLLPALKALISSYNHDELTFHLEYEKLLININSDQETKIYYIVVELLQNVIKHSQASICTIEVSDSNNLLSISIKDNGIGIKEDPTLKGLGLNSIRARLVNMDGKMIIQKNNPRGTNVSISIPLT